MIDNKLEDYKNRFIQIFNEVIIPEIPEAGELLRYLDTTDFFTAPASTQYHLCVQGGLVQHTLNVYDNLIKLLKCFNLTSKDLNVTDAEIALTALCHDLCKINFYVPTIKNVKEYTDDGIKSDSVGKFNWVEKLTYTCKDDFVLGHGEKSLFFVQYFIPHLGLEVAQAIRWHMGPCNSVGKQFADANCWEAFKQCKLACLMHLADVSSAYLTEL